MTQEEKELLLKDLCARLPYGVKIRSFMADVKLNYDNYSEYIKLRCFRPYLRPMSSMTEEEEDLLSDFNCYYTNGRLFFSCGHTQEDVYNAIDWLNKKMFGYRTLDGKDMFELGIALRAPEGMYKNK